MVNDCHPLVSALGNGLASRLQRRAVIRSSNRNDTVLIPTANPKTTAFVAAMT